MKTILLLACPLLLSINSQAWQPPIGIPEPDWGGTIGNPIELDAPKPPEIWTTNIPKVYFVQSGGTNTNEGYPGNPRNEIPGILPAGSVVFVNGTYTKDHSGYYIRHTGTPSAPCWILSYDPLKPALATNGWTFVNASYLIVDNIDWDWSTSVTGGNLELGGGVDHVCFRNGSTTGRGIAEAENPDSKDASPSRNRSTFVIQSSGSLATNPTEQLVIYNMHISKGGNWQYAGEQNDPDAHGISIGFPVQDFWIVDNEISYFSGCALQIGAGSIGSTNDANGALRIYTGRNLAHHIAQSALWSKRSNDCVMSENTIHTLRRDTPSSPNSSGLGAQYGPRNLWIIFNTVYNCQSGIKIESGADLPGTNTDIFIIGNLLYNIHDMAGTIDDWRGNAHSGGGTAILLRGGLDHYIVNNTIHDFDSGILSPIGKGNRFIEGNILSSRNPTVLGVDINFPAGDSGLLNTVKYNIIQGVSGACYVRSGDTTYKTVASLNSGKGPGNSNVTPTYINSSIGDFHLTRDSFGIDAFAGTAHKTYALFEATYGRNIAFDRSGISRPQNANWDIGAYEYSYTIAPKLPPPHNPKVAFPK